MYVKVGWLGGEDKSNLQNSHNKFNLYGKREKIKFLCLFGKT